MLYRMYVHKEYPMALQMAEDKFDKSNPHPRPLCNSNYFDVVKLSYEIKWKFGQMNILL